MGVGKPDLPGFTSINGTDLSYLEEKERELSKKISNKHKGKPAISPEGRSFLHKTLKSKVNPASWDSEYREHMIYRVVYMLVSPFPPKKAAVAKKLGIHPVVLQRLIKTEEYVRIKNELRKDLRSRWSADMDQVVIKNGLRGSKYHAELFYKLCGELIDKTEVTNKQEIPSDPEERKKLIKKYLNELGYV